MFKVYETLTGKRRYMGISFKIAQKVKTKLERSGIKSSLVVQP